MPDAQVHQFREYADSILQLEMQRSSNPFLREDEESEKLQDCELLKCKKTHQPVTKLSTGATMLSHVMHQHAKVNIV